MCGRFARHSDLDRFTELIGEMVSADGPLPPSWNIAPSQPAMVARRTDGVTEAVALRWGLLPGWVSKPGVRRPINARAESVAGKPMFRHAFRHRRCLVLADGYFEWRRIPSGKEPWYLALAGGRPFAMAGLWERNERLGVEAVETFCIITVAAAERVLPIYDRMPVIIAPEDIRGWLDPAAGQEALTSILARPWTALIEPRPVGRLVNNPANDRPECIEPLPEGRQGNAG
jgi:putative SOS response-associated peptidase YedK